MAPDEVARLLRGNTINSLSREEREQLLQAALADQDVFNAVAESEILRDLLDDRTFRHRLGKQLGVSPSWFRRPAFWMLAAAAAAAVVLIVVQVRPAHVDTEVVVNLSGSSLPAASMLSVEGPEQRDEVVVRQRVLQLPTRSAIPGVLALNKNQVRPNYTVGEALRVGFWVERDCNALLVEQRPDGTNSRLFPNRFVSSPSVKAGDKILIPPPGQGDMLVEGPPGTRRLRLLLVPPDVNPFSLTAIEMNVAAGKTSVIERTYTVAAGR